MMEKSERDAVYESAVENIRAFDPKYGSARVKLVGKTRTEERTMSLAQVMSVYGGPNETDEVKKVAEELQQICKLLKEANQTEMKMDGTILISPDLEKMEKGFFIEKIVMKTRFVGTPIFEVSGTNIIEREVSLTDRSANGLSALLKLVDQMPRICEKIDALKEEMARKPNEAIAALRKRFAKQLLAEAL